MVLAIISKARMVTKLELVIGELRALHKLAVDPSVQKNLKRAITSTQNALQTCQRRKHNLREDLEDG